MPSVPCVLIGLPAVGKTSVGRALAAHLGREFIDLDEAIEAAEGRSIPDIFAADGETAFRRLETEALRRALARRPAPVIGGGGGIPTVEANRALLATAHVIWLDAPDRVLLDRLDGDSGRPLLEGDRAARLRRLRHERLAHYTVCADQIVVEEGSETIDDLVRAVSARMGVDAGGTADGRGSDGQPRLLTEVVEIGGGRSYPVLVGPGAVDRLPSVVPDGVRRVAVVTQAGIGVDVDPGVEHRVFTVADGEGAKRLEVVGDLASQFARWGLTRRDAVVSVGGGVVSDLAGFVAATYHRGIPVVHVSTTLLGQIDAAIGGKCGVNLPEGKNLLGAFKQPAAVICDTATLATLPVPEFRSGMGELAKYHFLGGGELDRLPLAPRVAACVRIKADVVADDELESGRRAILNYGHTLGHALEAATGYGIRHGEAVAVGLLYAAELARALGRIDDDRVAEHRRVIDTYGLEPTMPAGIDGDEIVELFGRDKKAVDGVTFVLDGPEGVEPVMVEDRDLLRSVLETVSSAAGVGRG
jgi:5-deoxy-5-amino-3-dehydroquinate synthase